MAANVHKMQLFCLSTGMRSYPIGKSWIRHWNSTGPAVAHLTPN